jgi:sarcosine oxidase gamma subunit
MEPFAMFSLSIALLLAAADAPAASPAAAPAKPKKICRASERTGSRMSKRVCKTPDEWAVYDRGDKAKMDLQNQQYKQNTHNPLGN